MPEKKYNNDAWNRFAQRVGWRLNECWIPYREFAFDRLAPRGNLPTLYGTPDSDSYLYTEEWGYMLLHPFLQRFAACELGHVIN